MESELRKILTHSVNNMEKPLERKKAKYLFVKVSYIGHGWASHLLGKRTSVGISATKV